jgi:hypothetical protein
MQRETPRGYSVIYNTILLPPTVSPAAPRPMSQRDFRALPDSSRMVHDLAMSNANQMPTVTKPAKERKISKRIRHCIDLLVTGRARTQVEAAAQAGITRERLCRALREDHVQTYLADRTRVSLSQAQAPAAAALLRLLDQARSEFVQKDVAIHLLNLSGHKVDKDRGPLVSLNISPGYIIDLSGDGDQRERGSQISTAGGVVFDPDERGSMIDLTPATDDEPSSAAPTHSTGWRK